LKKQKENAKLFKKGQAMYEELLQRFQELKERIHLLGEHL